MKCPDCGAPNPEGAQFCNECGKQLPELGTGIEEQSKPIQGDERVTASPASQKKGGGISSKVILLIIVAVVVVGAAAAYFILPSFLSNPQAATVVVVPVVSGTATLKESDGTYTYNVAKNPGYGSGFIVNKEGYIVTAAHVVCDPYEKETEGKITKMDEQSVKWWVAFYAAEQYLNEKYPSWTDNYPSETEAYKELIRATNEALSSGEIDVKKANYDIYIGGPAFPNSFTDENYVAQVVDFAATDNQEKDLALLKVDNPPANLPTVSLSSQKPKTGDPITIYGYPGDVSTWYEYKGEKTSSGNWKQWAESMANATLTKGYISGERTTPKGTTYFQTDSAVTGGNSGGPALNSNNQVIGVLVEGTGYTGNFNFILSYQYVMDLLKKNGVT